MDRASSESINFEWWKWKNCFFLAPAFNLLSTFPSHAKYQQENHSIDTVYDSFTFALMSKRIFNLRASIIIYNPDKINNRYLFF
jgi:hypothetical protein